MTDDEILEGTILGYRIKDLLIFAEMCKEAEISTDDMKAFSTDVELVYKTLSNVMRKMQDEVFKRIFEEIEE